MAAIPTRVHEVIDTVNTEVQGIQTQLTNIASFQEFVCLFVQSGTGDPGYIVLKNTMQTSITFSRAGVGVYYLYSLAFNADKLTVNGRYVFTDGLGGGGFTMEPPLVKIVAGSIDIEAKLICTQSSSRTFGIVTSDHGAVSDSVFAIYPLLLEIKVYPS